MVVHKALRVADNADTYLYCLPEKNGIVFCKKMFSYLRLIIHIKPVLVRKIAYYR